jgi:hypothetical protein
MNNDEAGDTVGAQLDPRRMHTTRSGAFADGTVTASSPRNAPSPAQDSDAGPRLRKLRNAAASSNLGQFRSKWC